MVVHGRTWSVVEMRLNYYPHPVFLTLVYALLLYVLRRALVGVLGTVETRDRQTLAKVRRALRFLCARDTSAKLVMTKDRSSALGEGASRRGRNRGAAKALIEQRRKGEKLQEIRKSLAEKLKFKKSK